MFPFNPTIYSVKIIYVRYNPITYMEMNKRSWCVVVFVNTYVKKTLEIVAHFRFNCLLRESKVIQMM